MPGQKISTLPPVNSLENGDQFVLSRAGTTYKITGDKLKEISSGDITDFNESVTNLVNAVIEGETGLDLLSSSIENFEEAVRYVTSTYVEQGVGIKVSASSSSLRISNALSSIDTFPGLTSALDNKAALIHSHLASDVTNFGEAVDDRLSNTLRSGTGIKLDYNDASDSLTISNIISTADVLPGLQTLLDGKQNAGSYADSVHVHTASQVTNFSEAVDDRVAALLQAGTGISLTYNDFNNQLTIESTVTGGESSSVDAGNVVGLQEAIDDRVGNLLVAGDGISLAYDDENNSLTVNSTTNTIGGITGLQAALDGKQAVGSYAATVHGHIIGDVTGLQTALDGKQAAGSYAAETHNHVIGDVTGLQTALDGKQTAGSYAAETHSHIIGDVTGLQTALDGKQEAGSYAAETHSHVIEDVTGLQTALDGKQAAGSYAAETHSHIIGDVTGLQTALDGKFVAPSPIDFGMLVYNPDTSTWVASAGLPLHDSTKIDDPATKNTNDVLTWDGSSWIAQTGSGNDATKLPLSGGVLTGSLTGTSVYFSDVVISSSLELNADQPSVLYVNSTKVGIGTETPTALLEVNGSMLAVELTSTTGTFTSYVSASTFYGDGSNLTGLELADGIIADPVTKTTNDVLTWNGSAWVAQAATSGSGTDNTKLPLSGGVLTGSLTGTSVYCSDIIINSSLELNAGQPSVLYVNSNAVGIGTETPTALLEVNGSMLVSEITSTTGTFVSWVSAGSFYGDGSNLTGLELADGIIADPVTKTTNDVLTWNGSAWIAQAAAGGGITNPNTKNSGDVLVYDGTTWNAVTPTNIYNNNDLRGLDAYFDDVGVNTLSGDSIKCNSLSAIELSAVNIAANVTANVSYYNVAGSELQLSDAGSVVQLDYGTTGGIGILSQTAVGWKPGTQIVLVQFSTYAPTVSGASGVSVLSNGGLYTLNGQYALATLVYLGSDTWVLGGNLV